MLTNRRDIIVAGCAILSIFIILILRKDTELYDIKVDITKMVFFFIFPQLFAGLSIHRAKFVSYFNVLRSYHRIFGYMIVGVFLVISSFCIFVNVPVLKYLNATIVSHMIFGILGFVIFPLKLYWVNKSPYTYQTAILGIVIAIIFAGLFITGVILF